MPKASEILEELARESRGEAELEAPEVDDSAEETVGVEVDPGETTEEADPQESVGTPAVEAPEASKSNGEAADVAEPELADIRAERLKLHNEMLRREVDDLRGNYEKMQANRDKLSGDINSKLERIQKRLAGRQGHAEDDDDGEYLTPRRSREDPEIVEMREQLERLRQSDLLRSKQDAGTVLKRAGDEFLASFPDIEQYNDEVLSALNQRRSDIERLRDEGRIDEARVLLTGTLHKAYFDAKDARFAKMETEARERQKSQSKLLKGRRRLATPAGVGTVRDPATSGERDYSNMSLEELQAEYKRMGRSGF